MEFIFNECQSLGSTDVSDDFSLSSSTPQPLITTRVPPPFPSKASRLLGRKSPSQDLGYHTLLSRPVATPPSVSPTSTCRISPTPTSVWSELSSARASPFPGPYQDIQQSSPCYIASCTRPCLSTSAKTIFPVSKGKRPAKGSPFDRLEDHHILRVFSFLSSNHLCVCSRVCRRWYFLAWEPQLWTSVTLSSERFQVDIGLKTIFRLLSRDSASSCLNVQKVSLSNCTQLTDRGLITIARRCPELHTLEIKTCLDVTDNGISEIVSSCQNLEKLDVSGCCAVTRVQMRPQSSASDGNLACSPLSTRERHLYIRYLDLTDCYGMDDEGVKVTVQTCPQITHLFLRRCIRITDVGVKLISSYCIHLRELSVSSCTHVTDFGMYELAKLGSNLRYLSVAKCDQVSDAGIKQIARHNYRLRYLNVRGCEAVSDSSMDVLARSCPRLRALDIGKCDVTDQGLRLLSEYCQNLKKLSVKSCDMITDLGIRSVAYYCRGLQQLNIQDCAITVEGYRTVRKYCKRCIIEHTNPGFF